jgi:hypothetical protein
MQAVARRPWALLATIVAAVGVHLVIIAALPKERPARVLSAPVGVAEPAPQVPAPQVQAFVPSVAAAAVPAPAPAVRAAKARPARVARTTSPPPRDDNATIDMRSHEPEDEEPIRIATPLPVTVVLPPSAH